MEELPLISVIVPVYNVEKWLERCVNSICSQTYRNLQIILVDDGSKDSSGELCDRFEKFDSRIYVIHKENGGLSDARNVGLKYAIGDLVSFIDSDDWVEPLFLENMIDTIRNCDCDIVGCEYQRCEGRAESEKSNENFSVQIFDRISAMSKLIDNQIQQVVWNKLYKKEVIENIPFEKGKYHEDEFWSYQVFGRIKKYAAISYIGYDYFQRSDSIMGERYSLKRLDAVEAKLCRQKYLEENMSELAGKGRINLKFTCLYHGQLALQCLDEEDQRKAIDFLKKSALRYEIKNKDLECVSATHRLWLRFSNFSFIKACKLRNLLKIGL